jgi:hypothetical protein
MPEEYVNVPIETEPDNLAELAYSKLQSYYPDWIPHDGELDSWMIAALARQAAEVRDVASDVPAAIFRYFGAKLLNFPPIDDVAATLAVTVTMKDNSGYSLPSNTLAVGLRDAGGVLRGFQNSDLINIAPGSTTAAVTLVATEEGSASSGLGPTGTNAELVTALERVSSVVTIGLSSGGQDAETDLAYLNRLAQELSLQAPRPIKPPDFAIYAKNIGGVTRALALDLYDPILNTYTNPRTVSVAITDNAGNPASSATKAAVLAYLQAARETNFLVYVIDPTYTTIDVQWDVNAYPGWDSLTVSANVNAAIAAYLNPLTWGNPPFGDKDNWLQQSSARFRDLIAVVGKAEGVQDINFVKIRTGAGAFLEQDIALSGAAPLPHLGTCTGTVH